MEVIRQYLEQMVEEGKEGATEAAKLLLELNQREQEEELRKELFGT